MLTVVFNRPVPMPNMTQLGTEFDFHSGDNTNLSFWVENYSDAIKLIQVDGTELDSISHKFNNIPVNVKHSVAIWRGELARFIMENW